MRTSLPGTFLPARGYVSGDGIFARSGTVSAKAMRCNARMAFVLCGSLSLVGQSCRAALARNERLDVDLNPKGRPPG